MSEFKSERLMQIVNELSFPRLPGSEGDPKGVEYCKKVFSEIHIPLKEEEVITTKFWVGTLLQLLGPVAIILSTSLLLIFLNIPWLNLILIVGILAILGVMAPKATGTGDLKIIGKPIHTKNLSALIPASGAKKGTIIISGHHDTKSQPLSTVQRSAFFVFLILALLFAILIYIIGGILSIITVPIPIFLNGAAIFFTCVMIGVAIPLTFNGVYNKSPGALDNASSVAVLNELSRILKNKPLNNYDVLVLITGSEELGMVGARTFVNNHIKEFPPESTYIINFDMVGYKGFPVSIITEEGLPNKRKVSPFLSGLAFEVAKEKSIELTGFWMPAGAATDRGVFTARKYDGIDFVVKRASFETHKANDNPSKFDPELAAKNCEIALGMMQKLDEK